MPGVATAAMFGFLLSLTELPRSIFVAGRSQTLPLYTWAETTSRGSHIPLLYCLNTFDRGRQRGAQHRFRFGLLSRRAKT